MRRSWIGAGAAAVGAALALGGAGDGSKLDGSFPCISRPSDYRDLGFTLRGKVAMVGVRPGDRVEGGQELVKLEARTQEHIVESMRLQAEDRSSLDLAKANLAYREQELEIAERTMAREAGSNAQVREAKFRRDTAQIEVRAAEAILSQRASDLARERARLEEMRIKSPIAGVVLDVRKREGETVDEGTPVLAVLSVDPLWLDVSIPTIEAGNVGVGQGVEVVWEDWTDKRPLPGKVIYKSPAGNAGARQVQVRVEVANPNQIPSGMHGRVRFLGIAGGEAGGSGRGAE